MVITESSKRILLSFQRHWGTIFQEQVINLIAYGSAAFPQTYDQHTFANNTVDLLVEVKNSVQFHKSLLSYKPQDYSKSCQIFGHYFLYMTQNYIFPMHSNHIEIDGKKFKYSVIEKDTFRNDLRNWKYLSFAGRLHKPITFVKPIADGIEWDVQRNRQIATAIGLLLINKGKPIPLSQLFYHICSISYLGDIRFIAGVENPNKIKNIVEHNRQLFKDIYLPLLNKIKDKIPNQLHLQNDYLTFHQSQQALTFLIFQLPQSLLSSLAQLYLGKSNIIDRIQKQGTDNLCKNLTNIISDRNKLQSFWMMYQNFLTGSPLNNLKYLIAKLKKKRMK